MQVRAGQKWRDVSQPGGPQIITVDSVEGNTVQGTYAPESGPPGTLGGGAWSVSDFDRMTLQTDPEWDKHRVVMRVPYGPAGDPVRQAMLPVGELAGGRSIQPTSDGSPAGGIAWWDVVAPSAEDAVELARNAVERFGPELVDQDSIAVNNSVGRTP